MTAGPEFWVRFWGVRGTVPCPGPDTLRYGGNTACVEIMCANQRLIFDAGTGLRVLGAHLNSDTGLEAHLFLTHTHLDPINVYFWVFAGVLVRLPDLTDLPRVSANSEPAMGEISCASST